MTKPLPPDAEAGSADATDPEPIGAIGERVLDDLAARRAEALTRLTRAHHASPLLRKDQP